MSDKPERREWSLDEIKELAEASRIKGYLLRMNWPPSAPGAPGCWFGGDPTLPAEYEWPHYHSKAHDVSVPMVFFGQVDCAQLIEIPERPEIPRTGTLFFFYDPVFDAEHHGKGSVIYVDADLSQTPERTPPPVPEIDYRAIELGGYLLLGPKDFVEDGVRRYKRLPMTPVRYDQWPIDPVKPGTMAITSCQNYIRMINPWIEKQKKEIETASDLPLGGYSSVTEYDPEWVSLGYLSPYRVEIDDGVPIDMEERWLEFLMRKVDLLNRNFEKTVSKKGG